jgi:hypothetical protein
MEKSTSFLSRIDDGIAGSKLFVTRPNFCLSPASRPLCSSGFDHFGQETKGIASFSAVFSPEQRIDSFHWSGVTSRNSRERQACHHFGLHCVSTLELGQEFGSNDAGASRSILLSLHAVRSPSSLHTLLTFHTL